MAEVIPQSCRVPDRVEKMMLNLVANMFCPYTMDVTGKGGGKSRAKT